MVIYSGFSHWKWWFSIATLNYQRVIHPVQDFQAMGNFWPFYPPGPGAQYLLEEANYLRQLAAILWVVNAKVSQ